MYEAGLQLGGNGTGNLELRPLIKEAFTFSCLVVREVEGEPVGVVLNRTTPHDPRVSASSSAVHMPEPFLAREDFFDSLRQVLPDFLSPAPGTRRAPMPRARWKELWAVQPPSATVLEQTLVKLVEQALWTLGADSGGDDAGGEHVQLAEEVPDDDWMNPEPAKPIAAGPSKKSKKRARQHVTRTQSQAHLQQPQPPQQALQPLQQHRPTVGCDDQSDHGLNDPETSLLGKGLGALMSELDNQSRAESQIVNEVDDSTVRSSESTPSLRERSVMEQGIVGESDSDACDAVAQKEAGTADGDESTASLCGSTRSADADEQDMPLHRQSSESTELSDTPSPPCLGRGVAAAGDSACTSAPNLPARREGSGDNLDEGSTRGGLPDENVNGMAALFAALGTLGPVCAPYWQPPARVPPASPPPPPPSAALAAADGSCDVGAPAQGAEGPEGVAPPSPAPAAVPAPWALLPAAPAVQSGDCRVVTPEMGFACPPPGLELPGALEPPPGLAPVTMAGPRCAASLPPSEHCPRPDGGIDEIDHAVAQVTGMLQHQINSLSHPAMNRDELRTWERESRRTRLMLLAQVAFQFAGALGSSDEGTPHQ